MKYTLSLHNLLHGDGFSWGFDNPGLIIAGIGLIGIIILGIYLGRGEK